MYHESPIVQLVVETERQDGLSLRYAAKEKEEEMFNRARQSKKRC